MGIFIYLGISKSVTKEEWEKVYQETLGHVHAFPLAEHNRFFLIRDKDWEKIFDDIEKQEEAFGRYYPMMRVQLNSDALVHMVTAITLNDELYEYCAELADIYKDKQTD